MPAIEVSDLTKTFRTYKKQPGFRGALKGLFRRQYEQTVAVKQVTFRVEPGEFVGFLGPNGAGKTTTLKLLTELIYPTSGRISVLGKSPSHPDVRRRAGYLPEAPYFYDYLSAEELLTYFGGLFGLRGEERRRRVAGLLDKVGLGGELRLPLRK